MAEKKDRPIRLEELTREEKMKYEIAEELGLLDQVLEEAGVPCLPRRPGGSEVCLPGGSAL